MRFHILYASFAIFVSLSTCAETITIHNHAPYDIYVGMYYVKTNIWGTSIAPATLQNSIKKIFANSHELLECPSFILMYNREIIFSASQEELLSMYNPDEYIKVSKCSTGFNNGNTYHIIDKNNVLLGYDYIGWTVTKPIVEKAEQLGYQFLYKLQQWYSKHPYANIQATVTLGHQLCLEEQASVNERLRYAHDALEQVLDRKIPLEKTPRIAICMSGGGMRAAISSHGFMAGLEACGLLNAITYCSVLSGSTWFLTDWMYSGKSLDLYYAELIESLSKIHMFSADVLAQALWRKYVFLQDTSLVDLYGALLGNTFLKSVNNALEAEKVTFSTLGNSVAQGIYPFPLCTAAETSAENHWVTFSPFNVSSESLKFSIPIWSFGRTFVSGVSTNFAPEQSLGFLMGLWGSAASGSIEDMLKASINQLNPLLFNKIHSSLDQIGIADIRPAGVYIDNPLYGCRESSYRLRSVSRMIFMDAGYISNLPIRPLLHDQRAVDIIIILDVSQDVHNGAAELKKAEEEIRQQGLPFPPIDYSEVAASPLHVFVDPLDLRAPIVIYLVPVRQELYDKTFDPAKEFYSTYQTINFAYDASKVDKLAGLVKHIIISHKNEIVNAIKIRLDGKLQ